MNTTNSIYQDLFITIQVKRIDPSEELKLLKGHTWEKRSSDFFGTEFIKDWDGILGNYTCKHMPTDVELTKITKLVYEIYGPVTKYSIWWAAAIKHWRITFGN